MILHLFRTTGVPSTTILKLSGVEPCSSNTATLAH